MIAAPLMNIKHITGTNFLSAINKTINNPNEKVDLSNSSGKESSIDSNEKPLPLTQNISSALTVLTVLLSLMKNNFL